MSICKAQHGGSQVCTSKIAGAYLRSPTEAGGLSSDTGCNRSNFGTTTPGGASGHRIGLWISVKPATVAGGHSGFAANNSLTRAWNIYILMCPHDVYILIMVMETDVLSISLHDHYWWIVTTLSIVLRIKRVCLFFCTTQCILCPSIFYSWLMNMSSYTMFLAANALMD